jgi:hypothetical protein
MNLTRGHPLVGAPHFHQSIDWPSRLLVSGGVEEEHGRFVPRPPWRAPTTAELAALAPDPAAAHEPGVEHCLCVYALPRHLHSAWWDVVATSQATAAARLEGFDAFVRKVAELLAFKDLPVPHGARFELVASQPGQRSIRWTGGGTRPDGLAFDLSSQAAWPLDRERRQARLWGGINLGEEAVSVVLVNLTAQQIQDQLARSCAGLPPAATLGQLAERFLTYVPDYAPVRLRLEPGEGYRLPAGGILVDACTLDLEGPAALLLIGDPGEPDN